MLEDEGYELAKALLMTHQRLYAPVWWDQPPVHPGMLQAGSALFGSTLQSFRLVAGLLCASSLWALAACASAGRAVAAVCDRRALSGGLAAGAAVADRRYRGWGGLLAPFAAVLLCISSMGFLSYGLSVTIMVPALGFGLGAVWLWQRFELSGNRWVLFGSGIVFGLGFQTKFTVLLFLPALAVEFAKQACEGNRRWEMGNGESKEGAPSPQPSPPVGAREKTSSALASSRRVKEVDSECKMRSAESSERLLTSSPTLVAPRCARPCLPSEGEAAHNAALPGAREEMISALTSSRRVRKADSECGKHFGASGTRMFRLLTLAATPGIWLAGFVYGVALVWAFFPEEDLVWLLKYHFRPEVTGAFHGQAGLSPMLRKLGMDWPIASFAVLGLFLGLVQRRWAVVFPTVFFVTAFLAHAWHRPWWDYYYLHLSLPMAWLGALGVQWAWDSLMRNEQSAPVAALCERRSAESTSDPDGGHRPPLQGERLLPNGSASLRRRLLEFWPGWRAAGLIAAVSFCLAGFLVELPERYERETAFLHAKPSPTEVTVLAELKKRRADTRWLYTDRPIWCAHASLLIPPELAVLSLKRIASGDITHAEFLRLLYHYRPEQILLQRRHFEDEKFHEFLRAFYDVVIEEGNLKYFVRRDWEAARKQKRASSRRGEAAESRRRGDESLTDPEVEQRLLTSSPTGDFPFASIRVIRGHLGGQPE